MMKALEKVSNKSRFLSICNTNIKRKGIENLLGWLEKSDFFTAPASTKFHGNYTGGLLEHSLNVYDCLVRIVKEFNINCLDESMAIVALFHDLCKANFYTTTSRNYKDEKTGQWLKKDVYIIDDKMPLGHGEKSCLILQSFMPLKLEELLAIRWHMGGFDSAVKGGDFSINKAFDMYKLVSALHIADLEATHFLEETKEI